MRFLGKTKRLLFIVVILELLIILPAQAQTGDSVAVGQNFSFQTVGFGGIKVVDVETYNLGYEFVYPGFSLGIAPGSLRFGSEIRLTTETMNAGLPWKLQLISPIYSYSLAPASDQAGFALQLSYQGADNYFKQVYYFDENKRLWQAVASTDYPAQHFVRAMVRQSVAKVAVFADPQVLTVGQASWYSYKPGLFAASPDFPKGSKLRVTNTDNKKTVEVVINDWGPDRAKHPTRVVDLSKEAFAQLAPLNQGVIKVAVSPIEIAADANGRVLGVKAAGLTDAPSLGSKAAIILNEDSGQVLLAKNTSLVWPIASLTKIVAASVFLANNKDLNKTIIYRASDATDNSIYADTDAAARINLADGDKLKVKDMLAAALIASANNAVESLVHNSSLTRDQFIARMNELVISWGATNTKFTEPTGLSAANVSTAEDYALITREAFKNDTIRQLTSTARYTINLQNRKASKTFNNTNQIVVQQAQANLQQDALGINGSKTGFINESGYCLMTRFKSIGGQFTAVTFGASSRQTSFNDMLDLIKYANLKS